MSQSFKCLLFSAGWLGARCSQGKDDILCRAGGNLLWLRSSCLLRLSAQVSSEHIKTQTNKPCHLETAALVTRLLNGMSAGIWSQSPVGSGVEPHASMHALTHAQSRKLAQMFADRRREINRYGHSGQTLHKAIYDLSFICLRMIDM